MKEAPRRIRFLARGRVQGVGFRCFACQTADDLGLVGWVCNLSDGAVEGEIQGMPGALDSMQDSLREGPSWARVEDLSIEERTILSPCESRMEVRTAPM